jgi:hypothetical protein
MRARFCCRASRKPGTSDGIGAIGFRRLGSDELDGPWATGFATWGATKVTNLNSRFCCLEAGEAELSDSAGATRFRLFGRGEPETSGGVDVTS